MSDGATLSVDTVIFTALQVEADAVVRGMGDSEIYRWHGNDLRVADIAGRRTLLFPVGAMGNVSSAQAVQQAIGIWNPSQIMIVGITGGARNAGDDVRMG